MNYQQYITRLGELMVEPVVNTNTNSPFQSLDANNILPAIIDYAEQRIYRELDLIETVTTKTATLVAGTRAVAMPAGVIVLQALNVITPAGSAPDDSNAVRNPLTRVSVDFLNYVCPQGTKTNINQPVPIYFADLNNAQVIVGPAPLEEYTGEFVCTIRPDPLSASNTTTILTTYIPDLFLSASMVFASGYQKNYGQQADDPKLAMSYEQQYQEQFKSAFSEMAAKKSQNQAWRPYSTTPLAGQPRE